MINLHVITNEAVHPPLLLSLQLLECIPLTCPHQFLLQLFQRPNNSQCKIIIILLNSLYFN